MGFFKKLLGVSEYASPVADPDVINFDISDATSDDADKLCNLGSAYTEFGQLTMAITTLQQATDVDPGYANAWYNLGNAYFRNSQQDKAGDAFQQAIHIDPSHAQAKHNLNLCR